MKKILIILSFLSFVPTVDACPAFLSGESFPQFTKRSSIRILALGDKKGSWQLLNSQIDPFDLDDRLQFFKGESWKHQSINLKDRVSFSTSQFGRKKTGSDALPCQSKKAIELQTSHGTYAYAIYCDKPNFERITKIPPLSTNLITHDTGKFTLEGETYKYVYSPKNQMLFDKVLLKPSKSPYATDSNLLIKSDFKNFFTFHFDSTDINSYMEDIRVGSVGAAAKVSFYLKLLMFKIKLALTTDVTFFEDSAFIPMVVYIPKDAKKYLNPKSGILYDWGRPKGSTIDKSNIVTLNQQLIDDIRKGPSLLASHAKPYCRRINCKFSFQMSGPGTQGITMNFSLKKNLVDKGFYPIFVEDVSKFNKEMDWERELKKGSQHIGFYFETTGLEKGNHQWDFWLQFGKSSSHCPTPISTNKFF